MTIQLTPEIEEALRHRDDIPLVSSLGLKLSSRATSKISGFLLAAADYLEEQGDEDCEKIRRAVEDSQYAENLGVGVWWQ